MFFTRDSEIQSLKNQINILETRMGNLASCMQIERGRVDALFKLYPHGIKKNGEPRKKAGRPRKVVTA
jgi:hypothetical protein